MLPSSSDPERDELRALEARIARLEQVVQGLQDSVHRESTRLSKRIGELEARTQPAALGRALSEDARKRGL
jgi:BMFP domain-containing protein YqiC